MLEGHSFSKQTGWVLMRLICILKVRSSNLAKVIGCLQWCRSTPRLTQWLRSGRFGASRIWVFAWATTSVCSWNQNSNTMESDRPQHDRPTAYVIAQQYSCAPSVPFPFYCSPPVLIEKFGARFSFFFILETVLVCNCEMWNQVDECLYVAGSTS